MSKETAGELLPCPFCGSTAEFGRVNDAEMGDFGGEFIQCTNHGCATSSMLIFPTMADATPLLVEKWNRRAADRELRQGAAGMPEPAAAELRFKGQQWRECTVEHAAMVLAAPLHEWKSYEVRYLYTAAQVQAMLAQGLAAQPLPQERKPLTDEQDRALCEAFCNTASDAFFEARPELDTPQARRIFYGGHRRAWIEYEAAHGITAQQGGDA